jgi:GDP-4-dehydro-6-deoxy-D-mannose reductase
MKQKVLITGSNGYLAQCIKEEIRSSDTIEIIGLDILPGSNYSGISYFQCDLCDVVQVKLLFSKINPDYIIHLASTFSDDFEKSFAINVIGSKNLLENCARNDVVPKLFFAGSAAEYGLQENPVIPLAETSPNNPQSVYGMTKLLQSTLAINYSRMKNIDLVVGRIFNLLGPGIPESFVVGKIEQQVKAILQQRTTSLQLRRLDSVRDFIDVRDVAKIIWHLVSTTNGQKIVNIGNGKPITIQELLNLFLEKAGLQHLKNVELHSFNKSDVSNCVADVTKLMSLYHNVKYSLEGSIDHIINNINKVQ